jgi:hypothetical protein
MFECQRGASEREISRSKRSSSFCPESDSGAAEQLETRAPHRICRYDRRSRHPTDPRE